MFSTLKRDIIFGNIEFICSDTQGIKPNKLKINNWILKWVQVLKHIYILSNLYNILL